MLAIFVPTTFFGHLSPALAQEATDTSSTTDTQGTTGTADANTTDETTSIKVITEAGNYETTKLADDVTIKGTNGNINDLGGQATVQFYNPNIGPNTETPFPINRITNEATIDNSWGSKDGQSGKFGGAIKLTNVDGTFTNNGKLIYENKNADGDNGGKSAAFTLTTDSENCGGLVPKGCKDNDYNVKLINNGTIKGTNNLNAIRAAKSYSNDTAVFKLANYGVVDGNISITTDINSAILNVYDGSVFQNGIISAGTSIFDRNINFIDYGSQQSKRTDFSSNITGSWNVFVGEGADVVLSGENSYRGSTLVEGGTLTIIKPKALSSSTDITIKKSKNRKGVLDLKGNNIKTKKKITLNSGDISGTPLQIIEGSALIKNGSIEGTITSLGGVLENISSADMNVESGRTFIRNMMSGASLGNVVVTGGQLWAQDDANLSASNRITDLTLETTNEPPNLNFNASGGLQGSVEDGLVLGLGTNKGSALTVSGTFTYNSGNIFLYAPSSINPSSYEGDWKVFDFKKGDLTPEKYQEMFSNTYMMVEDSEGNIGYYQFNSDGSVNPINGTSQLLRSVALEEGSMILAVGKVDLDDNQQNNNDNSGESVEEEIEDEIIDEIITGDDNLDTNENQDGDSTGDGGGTIDFGKGLLEDIVINKGVWTKRELVEIVKRGLLPRNIDGAGESLANFNNLLTDTIFERTPMRQFKEVDVAVVQPTVELEVEPSIEPSQEPVRGLWSKSSEIDDQKADAYLDQTTKPMVIADAHTAAEHQNETIITINGITYEEKKSLTAEYADRDGVRGWFRGFGGRSGDYNGESDTLFNRYSISGGGGVLGADVSISESFQLGAYANYGNISLTQRNGIEGLGGGWNADGWGGGITADYSTNNFYVQGMLGATGFSGQQRRNIKEYGSLFDAQTAKGEKSATSMLGALRIGAPMQSGNTYIEPQFTASWTGNNENSFSESTDNSALGLSYKQRNTNYLQTALGVKFAWPIDTGTTGLMTPSIRVGWLADWNMGNESQTIGLDFTDKTYSISSNQENQNGALIEAGLDYSVAQIQSTSVKAYLRGGAEVWGGNRGTNWRASGGMTFQF